jgi:hypothetical protein
MDVGCVVVLFRCFCVVCRYFVVGMFITLPPLEVTDSVHANPAYAV